MEKRDVWGCWLGSLQAEQTQQVNHLVVLLGRQVGMLITRQVNVAGTAEQEAYTAQETMASSSPFSQLLLDLCMLCKSTDDTWFERIENGSQAPNKACCS